MNGGSGFLVILLQSESVGIMDSVLDSVWWQLSSIHSRVTTDHLMLFVELLESTVGAASGFLSLDPGIRARIDARAGGGVGLTKQEMLRLMCDDILLEIKIVDLTNSVVYGTFEDDTHVYVDTTGDIMAKSVVLHDDYDDDDNYDDYDDDDDGSDVADFVPLTGLGILNDATESVISPGISADFDSVPASPSSAWSSIALLESLCKLPVLPGMIEDLKLHHGRNMAQYRVLEDELDRLTDQNVHDWYRLRQLNSNNDTLASRIRSIREEIIQIGKQFNHRGPQLIVDEDPTLETSPIDLATSLAPENESLESAFSDDLGQKHTDKQHESDADIHGKKSLADQEKDGTGNQTEKRKSTQINKGAIAILLLCILLRYIG